MKNNLYKNADIPIRILDTVIVLGILALGVVLAFQL